MQPLYSTPIGDSRRSSGWLPWLILLGLLVLLLILMRAGYWRAGGAGSQVQVPMFYDAHYLYPRPWTQEQAAPGVPDPAPLAVYGLNSVSQAFRAGADQLAMIALTLGGPQDTAVTATLTDDLGRSWRGDFLLPGGLEQGPTWLTFEPIPDAGERLLELTLSAPEAAAAQPLLLYAVGGDRLWSTYRLNDFSRPGNLALTAYGRGAPGGWWAAAVAEQFLPAVFRLRLQQYKPPLFKGSLFAVLLVSTAVLTVLLLWLARPVRTGQDGDLAALGWLLVLLFGSFMVWQGLDGRLLFPAPARAVALAPVDSAVLEQPGQALQSEALYADLTADLWSAAREPEARFVTTELFEGQPSIAAPAGSRIRYALTVPPGGRLRAGLAARDAATMEAEVRINDEMVALLSAAASGQEGTAGPNRVDLDLSSWAGQGVILTLAAAPDDPHTGGTAVWIMPQISTSTTWLPAAPPESMQPTGQQFGDGVTLLGFEMHPPTGAPGSQLAVSLYWQALAETSRYGVAFVHLVDADGRLVAQHDAQPVNNVFPIPRWRAGMIVRDDHTLLLPPDLPPGSYTLYAGLYDPDTLERWPVLDAAGVPVPDGRALLTTQLEVRP